MDWAAISTVALGWLGQNVKAYKQVPTWAVQAVMFGAAFGFYALGHHYAASDTSWFQNGVSWALASLGVSSVTGATGLAPKTDSKP